MIGCFPRVLTWSQTSQPGVVYVFHAGVLFSKENTIRDGGSTTLYAAYTVFAVDMVYTVGMVYPFDMVYTGWMERWTGWVTGWIPFRLL